MTTAGGSWWVTQCKPDEPPLALACPSSLKAGASTTLAWEGGPAGGKVVLYLRVLDTADGALPASGRHLRTLPANTSFYHFVNMAAASRRQLMADEADNDEVQVAALVTGFGIPAGKPLPPGLMVPAGGQVELAWSGGLQYSSVQFALQQ
ncbi:hypothetical protein HaLaN_09331, partial [Haematococcus lacustris]